MQLARRTLMNYSHRGCLRRSSPIIFSCRTVTSSSFQPQLHGNRAGRATNSSAAQEKHADIIGSSSSTNRSVQPPHLVSITTTPSTSASTEVRVIQFLLDGKGDEALSAWRHAMISGGFLEPPTNAMVLHLALFTLVVEGDFGRTHDVTLLLSQQPLSPAERTVLLWLRAMCTLKLSDASSSSPDCEAALKVCTGYLRSALSTLRLRNSRKQNHKRQHAPIFCSCSLLLLWRVLQALHAYISIHSQDIAGESHSGMLVTDLITEETLALRSESDRRLWRAVASVCGRAIGPVGSAPLPPAKSLQAIQQEVSSHPNGVQGSIAKSLLWNRQALHSSAWSGTELYRSTAAASAVTSSSLERRLAEYRYIVSHILCHSVREKNNNNSNNSHSLSSSRPKKDNVNHKDSNDHSKGKLHSCMDAGDWAGALRLIPQALEHSTPLHQVRKALGACVKARPNPGASWQGALTVWQFAVEKGITCADQCDKTPPAMTRVLSVQDVGRLMSVLAHGHRWREALHIYESLPDHLVDSYVVCQVLYALRMGAGGDNKRGAVMMMPLATRVWAHWRCLVGDTVEPSADMSAHFLHCELFSSSKEGGEHGGQSAATLLLEAVRTAKQQNTPPLARGVAVPFDFEANEKLIACLLQDRWFANSWQSALSVALTSQRRGLVASVAQHTQSRTSVFHAISSVLDEASLSCEERSAIVRHAVGGRRAPREAGTQAVAQGERAWVETVLQHLLGGKEKQSD